MFKYWLLLELRRNDFFFFTLARKEGMQKAQQLRLLKLGVDLANGTDLVHITARFTE